MNDKVFIVMPAYNEGKVIANVIAGVKKAGYNNVIVVDDGSDDDTSVKAEQAGAVVVRHLLNRGKGAAAKTGVEATKILGADVVVTFDADGQHEPSDIKKLVHYINEGYEVVLGTRDFSRKEIPFFKKLANLIANVFIWLIYSVWVEDSQSGFRAYSKKALRVIDLTSDRYNYESEVIKEIAKHNLNYKQMPINVYYTEYSQKKNQRQNFISGLETLLKIIANPVD
ncbi:glycosyltransferase family 2 protein [Candidatus Roizmanbacteria bacterium CG02_land_8_20_14_3_00_36_15]|uniref:Glycosyltransferase family 2 protein n=2 Tax=Candidatus Roizmaniibacteriota TaxID=1752723 RepID=A0A2M8KKU7_9BACT|nr:MAG: glycosyltransferase family 2 protein [Candidatus Roizmanbacteria bacterium CG03_land_8_20_14_0_80_36_21]PIV37807.1 MAG: glycosyltransferase family 2 protein [Candidatus Roizmanbacteria bacterium CG02_land_8_20_14_3_00_36_15]PIY70355.1 MAG: glycosyltransferase family 2 protein [Candidatus Roizmanbacteria bacterium CG_4_10_14_0_8_um_filter_36_36]PJA52856.1 MAG: glycosyltransferase family 2 protein [Candidatus Roizmanbacteria bacterium CG_4_9_14_3_um_filter_36_11]PJC81261.1 MAG: glycosyltr